ncbi:helix-turn-helix domain containing protein [Bacillus cereus]|uniref:helix-turn-helix domain containing protein n=1 Tax=Bacillus cereus TaxID=1396 RepID=UPI000BFA113C|nr:helix-turn-helix domain containing protein [Bacillus cereus]PFA72350.1 hypothetical protein CN403_12760 [Bacillus cereus]
MNTILYSLINDKGVQRKISILELLNNNKDYMSSNSLAAYLECSSRTILNDIYELKRDLPENWDISSIKSKGHKIIKPINENINLIIYNYLKDSIIFKIMVGIFNGKHYTLEKWSQILFINKTTLKSILQKFNKTLKMSRIKLTFRVLKLEGNEINIRYFYTLFFYLMESYTSEFYENCLLRGKVKRIINSYDLQLNLNLLANAIYVFVNRNVNKYNVKQQIGTNYRLDCKQLECFKEILSAIENHYKLKLSENEIQIFKLCFFLALKNNKTQKMEIFNYYNSQSNIYKLYNELFKTIEEENQLNEFMKNKLIFELGVYIYKISILNHYHLPIQYLINRAVGPSKRFVKLYKKNYSIILKWNKLFNNEKFNKYEIEYLAMYVTLHLYSNPKKIYILLKFSGTTIEENGVYLSLKNKLGEAVEIHRRENRKVKYDYIVANHIIEKTKTPVFNISRNNNLKEIEAIGDKIM